MQERVQRNGLTNRLANGTTNNRNSVKTYTERWLANPARKDYLRLYPKPTELNPSVERPLQLALCATSEVDNAMPLPANN